VDLRGVLKWDLSDAYEYIFQKYTPKLRKWTPQAFTGKPKPKLQSVITEAARTIASLQVSPQELAEAYAQYRLSSYKGAGTEMAREAYVANYGLDTLTGPLRDAVDVFVREGWK
jgi:hypothetical protein